MAVSAVQQAEATASAMLERARRLQEEALGAAEAAKTAAERQAQREAGSIRSTAEAEASAIVAAARAIAERDASTWTGDIERKHAQKAAFNQARQPKRHQLRIAFPDYPVGMRRAAHGEPTLDASCRLPAGG
jgi:hypothetical protein